MSNRKMTIGITDGRHYENYANWITKDETVDLIRLGYRFGNLSEVQKCDALFLTGGEDVHPRHYGKPEYVEAFNLTDLDERRDEFELELLDHWKQSGIPMLGVCRGQQLTNVFLGGTLLPDLPSFGKYNHARKEEEPRYHLIQVDSNSRMNGWMGIDSGMVTSVHHQSIDRVARGLVTNALSQDGVIEGVEWIDETNRPPLVLVQWHPELMKDGDSPFSKKVREHFLTVVKRYHSK